MPAVASQLAVRRRVTIQRHRRRVLVVVNAVWLVIPLPNVSLCGGPTAATVDVALRLRPVGSSELLAVQCSRSP
jgi:hypothetical protein